jgi:RNA polymerase sigma-70 factor, ECF subfamily
LEARGEDRPLADSDPIPDSQIAADRLTESLYLQLKELALARLRSERRDHTLQATALVHEVWMRIGNAAWSHREHLMRVAAKCMRQVLTDYARGRRAHKRGGDRILISLGDGDIPHGPWSSLTPVELIALDTALTKLQTIDERQCLIVELRFFGGLTESEIAASVGLSVRSVRREWESARGWLHAQMRKGDTAP